MTATIRKARQGDAPAISRVHIDSWRTTYRGIVPDAVLDNLSMERRRNYWQTEIESGPSFIFVAEIEEQIVGFANGGPERDGLVRKSDGLPFDAELYAIYLLEAQAGRGIGTRLFLQVGRELFEAGFRRLALWVLTENEIGRRFYEARGGQVLGDRPITIGEAVLKETAYGWDLPLPETR